MGLAEFRVQSLFEPNTANRPRKPYKPLLASNSVGLARRLPGVRVAPARCRRYRRVGTASRRSVFPLGAVVFPVAPVVFPVGTRAAASVSGRGKRRVGAASGELPFKMGIRFPWVRIGWLQTSCCEMRRATTACAATSSAVPS